MTVSVIAIQTASDEKGGQSGGTEKCLGIPQILEFIVRLYGPYTSLVRQAEL